MWQLRHSHHPTRQVLPAQLSLQLGLLCSEILLPRECDPLHSLSPNHLLVKGVSDLGALESDGASVWKEPRALSYHIED